LIQDNSQLEEVVVVGYGTQKKGNLTTAISTIKGDDVLTTTHTSLAQRLEGKVPGLQIRQNSGVPGEYDSMINIRGFGTPLIIVDGTTRLSSSDFQKLNPEDIENISVLKDGSAAIYGMNAANGVILVTTKRGTSGRAKFTYDATMSISKPTDIPNMMNAYQYASSMNDAAVNVGNQPIFTKEAIENYKIGASGFESTNWYDLVMKRHVMEQQHTISATGGNENINYYTSFGYVKDPGLLKTNDCDYEKYTVRSNITAQMTKYLKAEVDMNGFYERRINPQHNFFEIIRGTVGEQPLHKPYANDNPDYYSYVYDGQVLNPLALADANYTGYWKSMNKSYKVSGTLTYTVPWIKGLRLKGVAYYEHGNGKSKSLSKSYKLYSYNSDTDTYPYTEMASPTSLNEGWSDGNGLTFQAFILYNNTFAKKHNVSFTGVYEQRRGWSSGIGLGRQYAFYTIDEIDYGDQTGQSTSGSSNETKYRSFLGRFSYDYMGKYMFEYAARYDGSYRYHPDHRWGFFPVYSLAWRASEETFFKNLVPVISNLKFRFSYGKVGEDAGDAFQYVGAFSLNNGGYEFSDGLYTNGAKAPGVTNNNLTWYKSTMINFGVDLGLFDNRLNFTMDIYRRNRKGLLAYRNTSLPNTFGATLPQENLNKDRVQGIEFSLNYSTKMTKDLSVNAAANLNFARTKTIYVEQGKFGNSYEKWRSDQTGRWNDIVWMYKYVGQFQTKEEILNAPIQDGTLGNSKELPGDFKYYDANNDGVIDGNDMLPEAWSGTPKMFYGFTFGTKYKDFDFSMLWQGSAKYTVRFTHYYATMLWNDANMPAYFYNRWHLSDQFDSNSKWISGKWPAIRNQADMGAIYYESNRWRKDASYLRLKSIELGYTIPKKYILPIGLSNVRISISGYNLLTFCDSFVKPFDPEKIEGAYSAGWVYPLTKSYNINLNMTF
jgi:TonB-linked SusC/RagA family outer membrane protein